MRDRITDSIDKPFLLAELLICYLVLTGLKIMLNNKNVLHYDLLLKDIASNRKTVLFNHSN